MEKSLKNQRVSDKEIFKPNMKYTYSSPGSLPWQEGYVGADAGIPILEDDFDCQVNAKIHNNSVDYKEENYSVNNLDIKHLVDLSERDLPWNLVGEERDRNDKIVQEAMASMREERNRK